MDGRRTKGVCAGAKARPRWTEPEVVHSYLCKGAQKTVHIGRKTMGSDRLPPMKSDQADGVRRHLYGDRVADQGVEPAVGDGRQVHADPDTADIDHTPDPPPFVGEAVFRCASFGLRAQHQAARIDFDANLSFNGRDAVVGQRNPGAAVDLTDAPAVYAAFQGCGKHVLLPGCRQSPPVEVYRFVAQKRRLAPVVGGENQADCPFFVDLLLDPHDAGLMFCIDISGGFVAKQHLRRDGQGLGKGDALGFTAGEPVRHGA